MRISDWSSDVCSSDLLAFSTEHGVPRSFSVTSTRPIEGKSTTCLALATTLSRGGKRVILIDGDMRNPSVHHLGGVRHDRGQIGRASCRERVCQSVAISVVAVSIQKKNKRQKN